MLSIILCCSDNYIGGMGASLFAQALKKNTSIEEFSIKGNEIGNEGLKALSEALIVSVSPSLSPFFSSYARKGNLIYAPWILETMASLKKEQRCWQCSSVPRIWKTWRSTAMIWQTEVCIR